MEKTSNRFTVRRLAVTGLLSALEIGRAHV